MRPSFGSKLSCAMHRLACVVERKARWRRAQNVQDGVKHRAGHTREISNLDVIDALLASLLSAPLWPLTLARRQSFILMSTSALVGMLAGARIFSPRAAKPVRLYGVMSRLEERIEESPHRRSGREQRGRSNGCRSSPRACRERTAGPSVAAGNPATLAAAGLLYRRPRR